MFDGYVVLISGATSGIGLATAKEFIELGATVIGTGRRFEKTTGLGEKFVPYKCDITNEEDIRGLVDFVREKFGKLDVLFNNAGAALNTNLAVVTPAEMKQDYELFYKGHVLVTSWCLELLKKSKNPSIIFTSSVASLVVDSMGSDFTYHAMKAAVNSFVRSCASYSALDLMHGIRTNAVCPGWIRTSLMPDAAWDGVENSPLCTELPLHRIGAPEETAKLVAFLASEKAKYINGAVIPIDGGFSITHSRAGLFN